MKRQRLFLLITAALALIFASCGNKNSSKYEINRIVSLGPSATEILFAIGAGEQVAARTDFCDYPAEAKNKPSVGGFCADSISLESIVSFEPDMVYLFSGMHDDLIKPLEDLGIKVFVSDVSTVEDVKKEILEVGYLTGHRPEAEAVVEKMNATLVDARNRSAEARKENKCPSVFWQVWDEPLMSVGKNSFINDVISIAGGQNILGDEESAYPIVSDEAVIAAKPSFIFITQVSENYNSSNNKILFYAMSKNSNTTVHYVEDSKFSRPGPRCADAVKELAEIMYGLSRN